MSLLCGAELHLCDLYLHDVSGECAYVTVGLGAEGILTVADKLTYATAKMSGKPMVRVHIHIIQ